MTILAQKLARAGYDLLKRHTACNFEVLVRGIMVQVGLNHYACRRILRMIRRQGRHVDCRWAYTWMIRGTLAIGKA